MLSLLTFQVLLLVLELVNSFTVQAGVRALRGSATPSPLGAGSAPSFGSRGNARNQRQPKKLPPPTPPVLKIRNKWACIKDCGACCYLAPEERPDLDEYLLPEELELYMSMVAEDGWCKHYDQPTRACTIYDERPTFCRVSFETFGPMYGLEEEAEMDDFCTMCCKEQIGDVYGEKSKEMVAFNTAIKALEGGEALSIVAP